VINAVAEVPQELHTLDRCVERNAARQAIDLADTANSPVISDAVAAGELRVAAAVYDIGARSVSLIGEED